MARRGDALYLRGKTWYLDFRHDGSRHAVAVRVQAALGVGAGACAGAPARTRTCGTAGGRVPAKGYGGHEDEAAAASAVTIQKGGVASEIRAKIRKQGQPSLPLTRRICLSAC